MKQRKNFGNSKRPTRGKKELPDREFYPGTRHPQDWKLRQYELLKEVKKSEMMRERILLR
jgi:hypothetical protein